METVDRCHRRGEHGIAVVHTGYSRTGDRIDWALILAPRDIW